MTTLTANPSAPDTDQALFRAHHGLVQIVALLWVYALYDELRSHVAGATAKASQHARALFGVERTLGLNLERGIQSAALHLPWLVAACNVSYNSLHLVAPPIVLVMLYRRAPQRYRHWRNVFVIMLGLAALCFWLYPVMPPRLVTGTGHLLDTSTVYFSLTKTPLASLVSATASSGPSVTGSTNPYAAMPSLHVGWAIWAAIALWPLLRRRWAKAALLLYPTLMVLAVLVTANHWVLDAIGGAVLVLLSHTLARAVERCQATVGLSRESPVPA
jgi:hypothetical protein